MFRRQLCQKLRLFPSSGAGDAMIPIASRAGTQYNLPTMYPWREYVTAGGMVSYGPSLFEAYRLVGVYTGKILRGAPPADLPVEQESKVDLVINLKATNAFQVSVPIPVMGRADEVIE